jgi:hypothetical protein
MTSPGRHAPLFDALPRNLAALVRVVQGLLLHEHFAPFYGVTLSDGRRSEAHIRPAERMLDRLLTDDRQPLSAARTLDRRLVGVCRHLAVRPDRAPQADQLALFDRLATLTRAPDAGFTELRGLCQGDDRLRVPAVVFNALRQRPEAV